MLLLITSVSNFSFAATPPADMKAYCASSPVCGTAPENFTIILDFVRELMNSIKTIGTQGAYLGKPINPNRFEGNVFTPPAQGIVTRVARNISQKIQFGLASVAILADTQNAGGLKNVFEGIALLGKDRVFMRDTKIVDELASQLKDKQYELGLGGGRYSAVNTTNLAIMQKIIETYIQKGVLDKGSQLSDGVTYNNITSLLTKVISAMKSILSFADRSQLDTITAGGDSGIRIMFSADAAQTIVLEYECARAPNNVCTQSFKKFKENIKVIASSTKDSVGAAITTIKDAVKRLIQVFKKGKDQSEEFKAREKELLTTMYGTQKVSRGLLFTSPLKVTSSIGKQIVQLGSDISAFRSFPKNVQDTAGAIEDTKLRGGALPTESYDTKNVFAQIIDTYLVDVYESQPADLRLASFTEIKEVTPAFKILGDQIATIKNDILGSKTKDGSLVKSLGEACELQCGGGGRCW
ncbi:MAG: hypothetical protein NTY80_04495 [candidate division SR1 bacterium]|nr:hypothetical protein [candidate division SR1 bacterium]